MDSCTTSPTHCRCVLLQLAYDGSAYHGFARQNGLVTVAGDLTDAIATIDPVASAIRATSRTDAGVHARGQLVAFDTDRTLGARNWVLALAQRLPDSISPRRAMLVEPGFEPRRHVQWKWYRYTLLLDRLRDPLMRYAWRIEQPFNVIAARQEASLLVGTHDFRAFRSSEDMRQCTVRTILEANVELDKDRRALHIDVRGDGFLHNMVRIIAGTIADVGRGRVRAGAVARALESGKRNELGMTAPANGLCLMHVQLREPIDADQSWP